MLSDPDLQIVRLIARMSFLTPEQVCRRYYSPKSITLVQTRLFNLVESKVLIRRGWDPKIGGGSRPYVYSLAPKTRSDLIKRGYLPYHRYRPSEDLGMKDYPSHTLAGNDVLITAEKLEGDLKLDHFIHERTIQRMSISYKPDAYLQFPHPEKPRGLLLEVDLDTEASDFWATKIKRMASFIESDEYDKVFNHFDGVLIVGNDEARTERLRVWTEAELERLNVDGSQIFHYATLEQAKSPEVFTSIL